MYLHASKEKQRNTGHQLYIVNFNLLYFFIKLNYFKQRNKLFFSFMSMFLCLVLHKFWSNLSVNQNLSNRTSSYIKVAAFEISNHTLSIRITCYSSFLIVMMSTTFFLSNLHTYYNNRVYRLVFHIDISLIIHWYLLVLSCI